MQTKYREYQGIYEVLILEKVRKNWEKNRFQQVEHRKSHMGRDQVSGGMSTPVGKSYLSAIDLI